MFSRLDYFFMLNSNRFDRLNVLYENQIVKKAKCIKQNDYENGPKAKKLFAWRTRKQESSRCIHKIKKLQSNKMRYNLEDTQNSFVSYYSNLYSQPPVADQNTVETLLGSLDLPSIGTGQNKTLTQQITDEEISKTISSLKGNKMPGPDGFPSDWYMHFKQMTIPILNVALTMSLKEEKYHCHGIRHLSRNTQTRERCNRM